MQEKSRIRALARPVLLFSTTIQCLLTLPLIIEAIILSISGERCREFTCVGIWMVIVFDLFILLCNMAVITVYFCSVSGSGNWKYSLSLAKVIKIWASVSLALFVVSVAVNLLHMPPLPQRIEPSPLESSPSSSSPHP